MKKAIINGRFLVHRVTGVERYAREILSELDKIVKPGRLIMAVPTEVNDIPDYKNIEIVKIGKFHNRLWEHISFPIYVKRCDGISVNLCNVAPLLSPGIVCIHDAKIKATPQYFSKKFLVWYNILFENAAKRAKAIITVSKFSKSELIKYYHINENRIYVIPNAWQHYTQISYEENALRKYGLRKGEYYFSMCSLEPNKNFKWIAEVAKKNSDQLFVIAGSINETVFANKMGFKRPLNMRLLGYISDEEAKTLMRDSKAFLFPTFYEGFGIPPLEALCAEAKQVMVSDTEVMHEILGNSVIYINPHDSSSFSHCMNKKISEDENRTAILSKYSWEKSAKLLSSLINNITREES